MVSCYTITWWCNITTLLYIYSWHSVPPGMLWNNVKGTVGIHREQAAVPKQLLWCVWQSIKLWRYYLCSTYVWKRMCWSWMLHCRWRGRFSYQFLSLGGVWKCSFWSLKQAISNQYTNFQAYIKPLWLSGLLDDMMYPGHEPISRCPHLPLEVSFKVFLIK